MVFLQIVVDRKYMIDDNVSIRSNEMKHFNLSNTGFNFKQDQVDEMNIQLERMLVENGIDFDDDTMVKYFAEIILQSFLRSSLSVSNF